MTAASLQETAQRLINLHGRSITLVKADPAGADAAKPWRGPISVSAPPSDRLELKAVFVDKDSSELARALLGDDARRGVQRFIIASLDAALFDVQNMTSIEDSAERWKVVKVTEIKPGETSFVYNIEVKR